MSYRKHFFTQKVGQMSKNGQSTNNNDPFLPKDGSEEPPNLLIPLENFKLRHDTFPPSEHDEKSNTEDNENDFIGRSSLLKELEKLLNNTKGKRGSYLIAGYRGSGKTSLINRALEKYNINHKKTKIVRINLGHDEVLDTRHVLFNIITSLKNEFEIKALNYISRALYLLQISLILLLTILISYTLAKYINYELIYSIKKYLFKLIYCIKSLILTYDFQFLINTIFITIFFIIIISVFKLLITSSKIRTHNYIKKLYYRVSFSFEKETTIGFLFEKIDYITGINRKNKTNIPEMKEPQIELEIINVLEKCRDMGFDVIFVFDELDKISLKVSDYNSNLETGSVKQKIIEHLEDETIDESVYRRKKRVDSLLASLKTLITTGKARFFFIAGRDMLDSYQSEKGSTSSLYESLFNHVFEVPSFLTDDSDQDKTRLHTMIEVYVCSRLFNNLSSKKENNNNILSDYSIYRLNNYYEYIKSNNNLFIAQLTVFRLRQFINYLTVHSWGNCKRLSLLFESFTLPFNMKDEIHNKLLINENNNYKNNSYMLHFGITEIQRICMGSNLYILFNHHLSRQFTGADKLIVSSLATLHYCMKFHRNAFSRHHLFRMTEMMSIYSSPELNSIFETTLTQAFWPYIRVIRNGMFRYRFFTWVEQEIRYIARINDLESASYTFSLDAINDIKAHYRKSLIHAKNNYYTISDFSKERGPGLIAELNIVLGDIYFLERAYDQAVVYYQTAVNAHHNLTKNHSYHLECLMRYVEALLKLGNVQEHRQRYERAAMNYFQAKQLVDEFLKHNTKNLNNLLNENRDGLEINKLVSQGDAKWVLLKQPYWAFLYLNLKRPYGHTSQITLKNNLYKENNDPYNIYNRGVIYFYLGKYSLALQDFNESSTKLINIKLNKNNNTDINKFSPYLLAKTCVNIAQTILLLNTNLITELTNGATLENNQQKINDELISFLSIETFKKNDLFKTIESFKVNLEDLIKHITHEKTSMHKVITLLLYSAYYFKLNKNYDHSAMAYLRAISILTMFLDIFTFNLRDILKKEDIDVLYAWFDKAAIETYNVIIDSSGGAYDQSKEKWFIKDLKESDNTTINLNKINYLFSIKDRTKLNGDIAFWHDNLLSQQLTAFLNWSFTTLRSLKNEDPRPLDSRKLTPFSTRSYILYSWCNGREYSDQLKIIINVINFIPYFQIKNNLCELKKIPNYYMYSLNKISLNKNNIYYKEFQKKKINSIYSIINEYKNAYSKIKNNKSNPSLIELLYIVTAKSIQNLYNALKYTRILVDNN